MEHLVSGAELLLLVILTIIQLGRWSQKTEDGPQDAARNAKDALKKASDLEYELRKHKHVWQDYLNNRYTDLDRIYARRREVELELKNIVDKQDADSDRITAIEQRYSQILKT